MRRAGVLLLAVAVAAAMAACTMPRPHRPLDGTASSGCDTSAPQPEDPCRRQTPEISKQPPYRLHFVEFDDQGWLDPARGQRGHTDDMGSASDQIDRVIGDLSGRLSRGERVMLFVFVHGWKHGAGYGDRDVQRFRAMLSDAASLAGRSGESRRTVIGIYIGWRGGGTFSASNPLVYGTFWTRKNTALHVSGGASGAGSRRRRAGRGVRPRPRSH